MSTQLRVIWTILDQLRLCHLMVWQAETCYYELRLVLLLPVYRMARMHYTVIQVKCGNSRNGDMRDIHACICTCLYIYRDSDASLAIAGPLHRVSSFYGHLWCDHYFCFFVAIPADVTMIRVVDNNWPPLTRLQLSMILTTPLGSHVS